MAGNAELAPEQAEGLSEFWEFSSSEKDYFLLLVLHSRAGTKSLKEYYRRKIDSARVDQENLSKRITEKVILPEASAGIFYSNWQNLAITILISIPKYRTITLIARRLDLSEDFVEKSLKQLEQLGLVVRNGQDWLQTQNNIHVSKDSFFNSLNHSHWRTRAVQDSFLNIPESVHYTSVCTLSLTDAEKIKQLVFNLIDESRKIVTPSKEEELFCLTCDWFKT